MPRELPGLDTRLSVNPRLISLSLFSADLIFLPEIFYIFLLFYSLLLSELAIFSDQDQVFLNFFFDVII